MRAGLLDARKGFRARQQWLVRTLMQPIWAMLLEEAFLKGEFDAGDFLERPWAWTRSSWATSGWGWVDPQKEVGAYRESLELGLTTRAQIVMDRDGGDIRDITTQLAEEEKFRKENGLGVFRGATKEGRPQGRRRRRA